ncbi:MAG: hypothetical protein KDE27_16470 [Planctomycetes bacterium]|nr:hypothetical protein [Planctomycetota bacterium]
MRTVAVFGIALGLAFALPQEPGKPAPKSQAPQDERKGVPARDPLEGVYRLRSRTVDGAVDLNRSRGYVAITHRHMLICLAGAGTDPDYPLLRAGVRTWQKRGGNVESVVTLGFYTDEEGEIHIDEPGALQVQRVDLVRGGLRIWQDGESYLDFERLE